MVTQVIVNDNTKSSLRYLKDVPAFANGKTYEFKPYINIVVGPNGSGKSTLLKLISDFMLCNHSMCSKAPNDAMSAIHELRFFDSSRAIDGDMFCDGVDIKSDYAGICFRYKPISEYTEADTNKCVENMALFVDGKRSSVGQQSLSALKALFHTMFAGKHDVNFPHEQMKRLFEKSNDLWQKNFNQYVDYIKRNTVKMYPDDFQYTVLLDEPDRNLDIDNVMELYPVLSTKKEMTQIIAVIHNPILIYKLSKVAHINFIEMEEGYVDKIKKFVEGA